ncbi:hypothetical protein [Arthrobacter bambusae]|uniref:hypothetical protein n=1 Tax=Arthrobacter bambusae TaxID=1338426 RepID=UPI00278730A4|nr:hypothetical protein [Arthrobacter bambusae]MDQ0029732.1 hypothetical protein [Arthrobacter bambusae]MDQ0097393.1 hypothetical protein [Arthrobacter bambusae]
MEAEQRKSRMLHVLRSVMLAGAGAVVWIALSSTAANADSGDTNNHTLLGGAGSTVSSVVHDAAKGLSGTPADSVPAGAASLPARVADSAPVRAVHLPAAQVPAAVLNELPQLAQRVDRLVATTPVVSAVVPDGTVGGVTEHVVSSATSAVDGVGSSVDSSLGRVVTPVLATTVPSIQFPDDVAMGDGIAGGPAVLGPDAGALPTPAQDVATPFASLAGPSIPLALTGTLSKGAAWAGGSEDHPAPPADGTFPLGTPGDSSASGGASVLSTNPSGAAAAWLQGTDLFQPLTGTTESTAAAGRVPAPVSFDPGSSPD